MLQLCNLLFVFLGDLSDGNSDSGLVEVFFDHLSFNVNLSSMKHF